MRPAAAKNRPGTANRPGLLFQRPETSVRKWTRRESNPCQRPKMLDFTIFFHRFILSDPNLTPQKSANIDHFHCFNLLFLNHMDILLISDIDIGMTHQFAYYLNWNASSKHCRSIDVTTTSKMEKPIRNLVKVQNEFGVSILNANGNYCSAYKILLDIAKIWEPIAEEDKTTGYNRQNALWEMMARKNRANILASILQVPKVLEKAYVAILDSTGSAQKNTKNIWIL